MGKSAVLSAWLARREAAGASVPHHFVRRQVADWDQPDVIVASLAAQLEALFPKLRDPDAKPERRLLELLGRVSQLVGPEGDLVVLIDGLDETCAAPGDNPLPRILPHHVPLGIRFLCSTRPTYPHLSWLGARNQLRRIDLDDKQWLASNQAVVRGFWEAVAAEYKPPLPKEMLAAAIDRAERNVLHAVMLHDLLQPLPPAERCVDRLPRGLKELIGEVWSKAASRAQVRQGLGLLCAAQEALSLDVLAELAEWSYDEREQFLPAARQLLLEEPASWSGSEAYRPRHEWVRELMVDRLGRATLRGHHLTLAQQLATWPTPREATARRYALRHALTHRAEADDWTNAWRLASDLGFLETKCRELGAHETETDLERAAERCRASGDEPRRKRLQDLARVMGRESHWLRKAPEATAAVVWNGLRRSGWSTEVIEQQLVLPAGAKFLRLRHLATRESPALVRDLVGHIASVNACTVTPDGRRIVSASADNTLKIWDIVSGAPLVSLQGHTSQVNACAVTPDGRLIVSVSTDRILKIWDIDSGLLLASLRGHFYAVGACAVAPDGRHVVSASDDQSVGVWDILTGKLLASLQGHTSWVTTCAVTPDGRRVISASQDQTLKIWDLFSGQLLASLEGHTDSVTACAVTSDGSRIISASDDGTLRVWDLFSGKFLASLEGHDLGIAACAITPDGRRAISASHDKTLKIWDLTSGQLLASLQGHTDSVIACAVTSDGQRVVSASWDQTLKVWDLTSSQLLATFHGHAGPVTACAVTQDGRFVISSSEDNTLKIWELGTAQPLTSLRGHTDTVTACAVTPDGRRVVSASDDKTLRIWDPDTSQLLATLQGHTGSVNQCAVTPDGRRIISASVDEAFMVWVWDLLTGQPLSLQGHTSWITSCIIAPDGRRVISASHDKTLKVWDLFSGQLLVSLKGHDNSVISCAVTPDGLRVVSASWDQTLKVWDLSSGQLLATFEGHTAPVTACAITLDGKFAISSSEDYTLKVWDLDSGQILASLHGHTGGVSSCVVTSDSRRIISVSEDQTLKIWDFESGEIFASLRGHVDKINSCVLTPDGRHVASVSSDQTLRVWDLESGECQSIHRASAGLISVTATTSTIICGDAAGGLWFLDWPPFSAPHLVNSVKAPRRSRVRHGVNTSEQPVLASPGSCAVNIGDSLASHDVFIVHADVPAEAAFVRSELVPALKLTPDRIRLSSKLPLGESIIRALEDGIASSRVTILVMSPALLRDTWASFGEDLAGYIAVTGGALVPLLLFDCELPPRLRMRVALDCRDPAQRPEAFHRLRALVESASRPDPP